MAKKNFRTPEDAFITSAREASVSPAADGASSDSTPVGGDIRRRTETKSKRINVLIAPSMADRLKAAADREQTSMNEIINAALASWLDQHNA